MYKLLFYFIIVLCGLSVYIRRPKLFFIYVLAIYPIVTPIVLNLFIKDNVETETFSELYFNVMRPIGYLLLLISILEAFKGAKSLLTVSLILPIALLALFFFFQSVLVQLDLIILYQKIVDLVFVVIPLFLLGKSDRLKPDIVTLMKFFNIMIIVEFVFSLFNLLGLSVYTDLYEYESFEKDAISGTFARYNHLANYLTTIYLVYCFEYIKYKNIKSTQFFFFTTIVFLLTFVSGSKVSIVLLLFSIGSCLYVFSKNKVFVRLAIVASFFFFVYALFSADALSQREQSKASAVDRVVGGLANAIQSSAKDDQSSTLFFSFILFQKYSDHLVRGNGYSFNGLYSKEPIDDINLEEVFLADARLAYTIVECGLIGCLLYLFFYYRINKYLLSYTPIKDSKINKIFWIYFLLLTITEIGIFDTYLVLIMFVYMFSNRNGVVVISKKI